MEIGRHNISIYLKLDHVRIKENSQIAKLGFGNSVSHSRKGKGKGPRTCWVLVAGGGPRTGEGTDKRLGTWRRSVGRRRSFAARESARTRGVNGRR